MRTVIVTGGAGFIGTHLVHALIDRGDKVIVIDNLSSSTLDGIGALVETGTVTFHEVDIRDKVALANCIPEKATIIYHFAADPRVKESVDEPVPSFEQNVTGTVNILEQMRAKHVSRMVFASSGGTLYGDVDTFPISETEPLMPISPYGASKAAAEMYLSAYAHSYGMRIVSLRLANIFGPGSNHGVMYDFFQKLQRDTTRLEILGDGQQQKSYLFVDDCARAAMLAGDWIEDSEGGSYHYFNLGTPEWVTVTELARAMIEIMDLENVTLAYTGGKRGWKGDVVKNLLDIEKIEKVLGWKPHVTFREGLARYLDALRGSSR